MAEAGGTSLGSGGGCRDVVVSLGARATWPLVADAPAALRLHRITMHVFFKTPPTCGNDLLRRWIP